MMRAKKGADASKGLTLTAQQIKFALGLFASIIVTYSVWWLFFHNYYERIAEQNMANLYNAIDSVCDTGQSQSLNFYLPQEAGFKGWVYQNLGVSGGNIGTDPYFYVYYERFPPEPPYELADITKITQGDITGIPGTYFSIVAPWSEDLPWSSNMMMTAAMDLVAFDTLPGFGKLQDAARGVKNKILTSIEGSNKLAGLVKAGKIIMKGKEILIGDFKTFTKVTITATVACVMMTGKDLKTCALFSAVSYMGVRAAGYGMRKAITGIASRINSIKGSTVSSTELENLMHEGAREGDRGWIEKLIEEGHVIEENGQYVVKNEEAIEAIEKYVEENPQNMDSLGDFVFTKDTKTGKIKEVILEKTKLNKFTDKTKSWWNKLKSSIGGILHEDVISPKGQNVLANAGDIQNIEYKRSILTQMKQQGLKIDVHLADDKSVENAFSKMTNKVRNSGNKGYVMLVEKDSGLAKSLSKVGGKEGTTWANGYFESLANKKFGSSQGNEIKAFYDVAMGKEFRIGEKAKNLMKGQLGYALLRVQDQTVLGLTYWDKQLSTYTMTGQFCQEGQLCLQMGYYVRQYDLPESCVEKGIGNITLKRTSIVASDPRFYLVSPCFSHLEISKQGDTIFIDPKICRNKPDEYKDVPNYCFATSGVVNFYVISEVAAWIGDCVTSIICNIVTVGQGGLGAFDILKCLTLGTSPKVPTVCGQLGQGVRLMIDLTREGIVTYPYVPEAIQDSMWDGQC